jgi:hypothetical protein
MTEWEGFLFIGRRFPSGTTTVFGTPGGGLLWLAGWISISTCSRD